MAELATIIDDLQQALADHDEQIAELLQARERVNTALTALRPIDWCVSTIDRPEADPAIFAVVDAAPADPATKVFDKLKEGDGKVECADCGGRYLEAGLLIHMARKHGKAGLARQATKTPLPKVDLAKVAEDYKQALRDGRRPISQIADIYDVDRKIAQEWVTLARTAGHLPPKDEPQVPGELPPARAMPRNGGPTL